MFKGHPLPTGTAKNQYDAFWNATPSPGLPKAVCYNLTEIDKFLLMAREMFDKTEVPDDQRGVALMIGIHLDASSTHAGFKPTLMMVATQFVDNIDSNAGKVDSINNRILKAGWPVHSVPPDIDDVSYNAGSLWP